MHTWHKKYTLVILVSVSFLLGCIYIYQKKTGTLLADEAAESLNYLPSGKFLKGIALGYDEAFADFMWVRTIGYFGTHAKTDQDYTWLTHMLRLTAELDPRYESPYEFAGVVLPSELEDIDGGIAFLEKGIQNIPKHNPRYWLQHFYLGFCYMIYKDDVIKAAEHIELAAGYPQSPGYLPLLVSRLYARADKPGVGIDIIQSILETDTGGVKQKKSYNRALRKRLNELIAAEHIRIIEQAVSIYAGIFNRKPEKLQDLVDGLVLPFIPDEPFGGSYFLSYEGKKVFSTVMDEDFRIYATKGVSKKNVSVTEIDNN